MHQGVVIIFLIKSQAYVVEAQDPPVVWSHDPDCQDDAQHPLEREDFEGSSVLSATPRECDTAQNGPLEPAARRPRPTSCAGRRITPARDPSGTTQLQSQNLPPPYHLLFDHNNNM